MLNLAILILLLSSFQTEDYRIDSTYDRFTNETTVRLYYLQVIREAGRIVVFDAYYKYKGNSQKIIPPDAVALHFTSTGSDVFGTGEKFYVIADQNRFQFDQPPEAMTAKALVVFVPFKQVETILKAKDVEFRVGTVEIPSERVLDALRKFIPKPAN